MMDPELVAEAALSSRLNTGRGGSPGSQIPLLTYGAEVRNYPKWFSDYVFFFNQILYVFFLSFSG